MEKEYRFSLVNGKPAFRIKCVKCGVSGVSDGSSADSKGIATSEWYADLNGEAYKDYYCPACKHELDRATAQ
jgi:hypothetical protein